MSSIPIWVFAVILLIFLSGYMAVRAFLAEKKLDRQFIEREGKIYMERIQEERMKRREQE
ncbi:sporulation YhaL family protein [Oceanobacillus sojae]|uniref:sporulation YhaL family protein n=1 Tax=Oceanobacillus sojae TaxID=582851 RepID=UPI0009887EF0|nr:sporulation YhaL family protein [Oceanobacillus sojae]MCT1903192.1 sporulation YhaL family protein [Oceanobacillus sojae]